MKLKLEIVALLRALDGDPHPGETPLRAADAPKQMFEFNFVSRDDAGGLVLTKTGARAPVPGRMHRGAGADSGG